MLGGTGSRGAHQPVTIPTPDPVLCWGTEPQTNLCITSGSGMGLLQGVENAIWSGVPGLCLYMKPWFGSSLWSSVSPSVQGECPRITIV